MTQTLRIWRVVPTTVSGVQAPAFFVETMEEDRKKAEVTAIKLARLRTALPNIQVERMPWRIDRFGRYVKYHQ